MPKPRWLWFLWLVMWLTIECLVFQLFKSSVVFTKHRTAIPSLQPQGDDFQMCQASWLIHTDGGIEVMTSEKGWNLCDGFHSRWHTTICATKRLSPFTKAKWGEAWNILGSESQKSALAPVAHRHRGPLTCIKGSLWGHIPLECSGIFLHTALAQCLGSCLWKSWLWHNKHSQRTDIFEDYQDPAGSTYHEHLKVFHRNEVGCKYLCHAHSLPRQGVRVLLLQREVNVPLRIQVASLLFPWLALTSQHLWETQWSVNTHYHQLPVVYKHMCSWRQCTFLNRK